MKITDFKNTKDRVSVLEALANIVSTEFPKKEFKVEAYLLNHADLYNGVTIKYKNLVFSIGKLRRTDNSYGYDPVHSVNSAKVMRARKITEAGLDLDNLLDLMNSAVRGFFW